MDKRMDDKTESMRGDWVDVTDQVVSGFVH